MKRSPWRYLWTAPDIRRKLLITLALLVVYRFAAHVPVPGAQAEAIAAMQNNTFMSIMNMLSGGTLANFSILAMGVYPYITAQIILQLLGPIIPALERRMKEDPRGYRQWMEKWTYILTVPMAFLNAIGQINFFGSVSLQDGRTLQIIENFALFNPQYALQSWMVVISMTAGTMFAIWLGELISEYGIRNQGLSLIIFAGIVSQIPVNLRTLMTNEATRWVTLPIYLVVMLLIIVAIVFVQQGRRNVPVMYPGRRVGRGMSMPVKGTLPLMVNMAGMIPLIFAQSILTFPAVVANFFVNVEAEWVRNLVVAIQNWFGGQGAGYWVMYFIMVTLFTFFYTDVIFGQQNYGDNLRKVGARIPGVTPGGPTQRYLTRVLRRITLPGALFLGLVAVMPGLMTLILWIFGVDLGNQTGTLLVTSSGLLIVVGVVRDTFFNLDAELKLRGYDDAKLIR